jgi:formate dehydrogenase subunit gamma
LIFGAISDSHQFGNRPLTESADMTVYEPWNAARGTEIIAEHTHLEGATLVILHALQEAFGYVPAPAIAMIASALNLSRAEVHGVFTFYHDFRHKPAGRHVLKLCRAEACQAAGGDALTARAEAKLGIAIGNTTPDERVTLEPIYCLGLCATAPSAMLDGRVVGRLDEARIDALVAEAQR